MCSFRPKSSRDVAACLVAIFLAGSLCTATLAADIYSNTIDGTNPHLSDPFTSGELFDSNISVTGIGRGSGIGGNTANNRYNARGWSFPDFDDTDYFTWTLTPNTGFEIDFNSVFGVWRRSNTGPTMYALRTSEDGFSSDIASGSITGASSDSDYFLDLSSLQDVDTSIEFRLYAWGGSNVAGTFSINDFIFDGEVGATSTAGLAGDFNNDGFVDAVDYTVWRNHFGEVDETSINHNGDGGDVAESDYDLWKSQYGEGTPLDIGGGGIAVPEPAAGALALLTVALGAIAQRIGSKRGLHLRLAGQGSSTASGVRP